MSARYVRRPRVGEVIVHATGPAVVTAVRDNGKWLTVVDGIGRTHHDERADTGVWTRVLKRAPRYVCKACGAESPTGIGYAVTTAGPTPAPAADCLNPHGCEVTR